MRFIIESCPSVPIYNRIATAIAHALIVLGHEVLFIDTQEFTADSFVTTINNIAIDFYISTNALNLLQEYDSLSGSYLFSKIQHKKIFIYHDSSIAELGAPKEIFDRINELVKQKNEIFHFCIEQSTLNYLHSFGINNAFKIHHASEFNWSPNKIGSEIDEVTFVGHLTTDLNNYPTDGFPLRHHLMAAIYSRISKSSNEIQPIIRDLTSREEILYSLKCQEYGNFPAYQILMHQLAKLTMPYRAEMIKSISPIPVNIIGGDLSYGTSNNPIYRMNDKHVKYSPATRNYKDTSDIYKNSKISLNISSLQFDSAFNNRIVDIICAGGFVLTDSRSDLIETIPEAKYISFETPEDFKEKISFYQSKLNQKKYFELKNYLNEVFLEKFNYPRLLNWIIEKATKATNETIQQKD